MDKDDAKLALRISSLKKIHPQEKGCMVGELVEVLEEVRTLRNLVAAQNESLLKLTRTQASSPDSEACRPS